MQSGRSAARAVAGREVRTPGRVPRRGASRTAFPRGAWERGRLNGWGFTTSRSRLCEHRVRDLFRELVPLDGPLGGLLAVLEFDLPGWQLQPVEFAEVAEDEILRHLDARLVPAER